jgi:hypothetical protein
MSVLTSDILGGLFETSDEFSVNSELNQSHVLSNLTDLVNKSEEQTSDEAPTLTTSALRRSVVLGIMAWFSIAGNIGVIVNIVRTSHRLNNTMYRLIRELAVADLLVSLFCLSAESAWTATVSWLGGNLLCKFVKFMQGLSLNLSTFVIVVIGLDRLVAIKYPMRGGDRRIWCYRAVGMVWILSAVISIPQVYIAILSAYKPYNFIL